MDSARSRKVLMGTCGWSDHTLLRCGKFYPASVRSAEDRLQHYSRHFPCVEVDTSTYAIPSPLSISRWVNAVVPGFLFHFKAFGLFCSKSGAITTLPYKIKNKLGPSDDPQVRLYDLPSDLRDELWDIFNSALQPAYQAGRLGVIVFQVISNLRPLCVVPSIIQAIRGTSCTCALVPKKLGLQAVEFRSRDWFIGEQMNKTQSWLASNNVVLIAADELRHETFQRDREQTGLPADQQRVVLPVAWPSTHPDFLYIRVHRREGTQRVLSDDELQSWETRLGSQLPPGLKGPIYFMWGTDWEDQPLINAKRLAQRLPKELVFDWKSVQKPNNRLESMFMAVSKVQNSTNPGESHEGSEDSGCLPPTAGLPENLENRSEALLREKSPPIGEEQRTNCPTSEQPCDDSQSSPISPPSGDLSCSPNTVNEKTLPQNIQSEGNQTTADLRTNKRLAQVDRAGLSLDGKPSPGKNSQFSAVNDVLKKVGPAKKRRADSNITPSITSFFKPAT